MKKQLTRQELLLANLGILLIAVPFIYKPLAHILFTEENVKLILWNYFAMLLVVISEKRHFKTWIWVIGILCIHHPTPMYTWESASVLIGIIGMYVFCQQIIPQQAYNRKRDRVVELGLKKREKI